MGIFFEAAEHLAGAVLEPIRNAPDQDPSVLEQLLS